MYPSHSSNLPGRQVSSSILTCINTQKLLHPPNFWLVGSSQPQILVIGMAIPLLGKIWKYTRPNKTTPTRYWFYPHFGWICYYIKITIFPLTSFLLYAKASKPPTAKGFPVVSAPIFSWVNLQSWWLIPNSCWLNPDSSWMFHILVDLISDWWFQPMGNSTKQQKSSKSPSTSPFFHDLQSHFPIFSLHFHWFHRPNLPRLPPWKALPSAPRPRQAPAPRGRQRRSAVARRSSSSHRDLMQNAGVNGVNGVGVNGLGNMGICNP